MNFWGNSTCVSCNWNASQKEWTAARQHGMLTHCLWGAKWYLSQVQVDRAGEEVTLRPKHLVLATGLYGQPLMPELKNQQGFKGDVMHSSEYKPHGSRWYVEKSSGMAKTTRAPCHERRILIGECRMKANNKLQDMQFLVREACRGGWIQYLCARHRGRSLGVAWC